MNRNRPFWLSFPILGGLLLLVATGAALNSAVSTVRGEPMVAANYGDVVINEVAWGGTSASSADEWIELYNLTDQPLALTNWRLYSADGGPDITLNGSIPPHGYYLIERSDDDSVSDVPADWFGSFGSGLLNSGEVLTLTNDLGEVIDTANQDGGIWPAGSGSPDYRSMERVAPTTSDTDANWASNDGITRNGLDTDGNSINGTPKARNSVALPAADLAVEKTGPTQIWAGERITYTLRLRNGGNLTATAVHLTDTLPQPLIFVTQNSTFTFDQPTSHTLAWELGDVRISTDWTFLATVIADVELSAAGTVTNRITASTSVTEIAPINNRATATTTILPTEPDLSLKKFGPLTARPGDRIIYTLHLSNTGPLTATAVRLTDTLPVAVDLITISRPFSRAGQRLFWDIGDLPGSNVSPLLITITGQVTTATAGNVTNMASVATTASEAVQHNNVATWTTRIIVPAKPLDVVINELAWMGTDANFNDEWIELYNNTTRDLDLSDWTLSDDGNINVALSGAITAGGYYLLERNSDGVITDVVADLLYSGSMANTGETLTLRDASSAIIDTANGDGGGWPAGINNPEHSMERIDPTAPDDTFNWADNDGLTHNGLDAAGQEINGTPKARNSAYVVPPPPQANLVVTKSGPFTVTPGALITYTIQLSNTGQLTATAVRVTDTLPAPVAFLASGSLFLFDRTERELHWALGDVPPSAPPLLLTITGRASTTAWGTLVNVVTVTTTASETLVESNIAQWKTDVSGGSDVLITAVLADSYVQSTDEAVHILNTDSLPVDLTGWRLNDDVDDISFASFSLSLPVVLVPGQGLWLTNNAAEFYRSFGFQPDYETDDSDPTVPDLDGNWPGYADDGDEVVLLNADGAIIDVLVYGAGDPDEVGATHWSGVPLAYLGGARKNGQIFARKPGLPDTNSEADWIESNSPGASLYGYVNEGDIDGKRVMYPAWASDHFSRPLRVTTTARLTVAVAPDNMYETIVAELGRAQESIFIEGYALTHLHLGHVITELIATRGINVIVLLDEAIYHSENREKWICQQIEAAGGQVYLMHNLDDTKRYLNQHAKFMIVDERIVIISSENYGYGSMPVDDKRDGTYGNRGVALITDAGPVVNWALNIFRADANPERIDIARWGTRGFDPPAVGYTPPVTTGGGIGYIPLALQPLSLEGEMMFEVIQSPETSLSIGHGLIGLLRQAGPGDIILVEMLNEDQHWGGASGNIADDPNPRLEAYIQAARQRATVRVLLDQKITFGSNQATEDYLNAIAITETLDLQARSQNPTGAGIHNKMVLAHIGGKGYVFVSSINGTIASNRRNRELGLLVQSDTAYAHLRQIFYFDWQPIKKVYLPLILREYRGPANHLLISEIYYNPPNEPGQDETVEWIELYNPTNTSVDLVSHKLGDAANSFDTEGMYRFPPGVTVAPGEVLVVALEATEFKARYGFDPDFEFLHASSAVPDMIDYPAWGTYQISLRNDGDEVLLLDGNDNVVDAVAWGDSPYPCTPHPGVASADHSLERSPTNRDSDNCSEDFRDWPFPSPKATP